MTNDKQNNGRLLRVSQAAKRLGVTRSRVHQFIDEGRLKVTRDEYSGWYLISERELERLPRGRDWRSEHNVEVGQKVRLTVTPYAVGIVDKVTGPDTLTIKCGKPHGTVVVSAWDVEEWREGKNDGTRERNKGSN